LPSPRLLVDADLAVHDLLDRQIEEERRQQRQVQCPDSGPARSHFDMERGRGLALVAGLEHAGAVEARRVRADGGPRHLTAYGHQREARELRGPGHETVEVSLDGAVRRARDVEPELRERAYAV